jgi:hypothetical protein
MSRQKTIYRAQALDPDMATGLYYSLEEGIAWEEGIRSRSGFTRKAKSIELSEYPDLESIVVKVIRDLTDRNYVILGTYLNYYVDGNMYTPNHTHPGTCQLVISLGATRTLNLENKSYEMSNGDAIIFGSSVHGVPKDPTVTKGRISIATFMQAL